MRDVAVFVSVSAPWRIGRLSIDASVLHVLTDASLLLSFCAFCAVAVKMLGQDKSPSASDTSYQRKITRQLEKVRVILNHRRHFVADCGHTHSAHM